MLHNNAGAQNATRFRTIDSTNHFQNYDSLRKLLVNKKFPDLLELPLVIALQYFPELDSTLIIFEEKKIKTTLNTRPSWGSLVFKDRNKRKYIIRINKINEANKFLMNEVPLNALIGLFGHEFCHIVDYRNRNIFRVLGRAFSYLNKKSKESFEKGIDRCVIDRGLGWQLYDWAVFVQNNAATSEKYKAFKRNIYLEPLEIEEFIKADASYNYIQRDSR
jgi:hypothetical protein